MGEGNPSREGAIVTLETFSWLTALLSMAGVVLNIRRHRACFAIWTVTNAAWAVIDAHAGIYSQSCLHATYVVLAVYGWFSWKGTK